MSEDTPTAHAVAAPICPACQGQLEEGFIPESNGHAVFPMYWVSGKAEKSLFFGVKTIGRRHCDIRALRCTNCGRLEFYAR